MEKPKLKTPPPPEKLFIDLDSIVFKAASASEQIVYSAVDPDGNVVATFDSAASYNNWKESIEFLGLDMDFGYEGDLEDLTRETDYQVGKLKDAKKIFDYIVEEWVEQSGCKEVTGYVSKSSGEENFRYSVARLKPYKGNRENTRKPHYLEDVRKYAASKDWVKIPRGNVEVDDACCAYSQKAGWKGCVATVDKDGRGVKNTHVLIPDEMDEPQFSSQKVVGFLWLNEKGKLVGLGDLFWLAQILYGDKADNYEGCKGLGEKGAYNLLKDFSGVDAKYLKDALKVVCETYEKTYGQEYEHYDHHKETYTVRHWKEILEEMCQLVYMKKSRNDVCPYLQIIEEIYNENNS